MKNEKKKSPSPGYSTFRVESHEEESERPTKHNSFCSSSRWTLDVLIVLLLLLVGYFSYALISRQFVGSDDEIPLPAPLQPKSIQVDVLNGSGASNVASRFTSFLRQRGIDVVEMKNYKTFDVKETLVIDRIGNLAPAQEVARVLGVPSQNVIQMINPDYFVQVSVIIGKDYPMLKPTQ